jgi:mannose-6-phosphate isomerase-like protein (cupin superfamily)
MEGCGLNQLVGHLSGSALRAPVRYAVGNRDERPWGTWEVLAVGVGYTLKRIVVSPGQRLSLQYHEFRAEHWTVVQGCAEAEIDGVCHALAAGEHVFVPLHAPHRVRNTGSEPLVIIEVQTGAYLDEHDIIRLSDDYGRK